MAAMRVRHLNCGAHRPLGGAFFDGDSKGLRADIPTHCLLIETEQSLVLVDTGYGLQDVRNPHARLPWLWPAILNARLHEAHTARRQIEAFGHSARDVRHIVLTHLDFDHAGGLEDFPDARVHVLAAEREAADGRPRNLVAAQRYRPRLWDGVRDWRLYRADGESWHGFDAVRALEGLPPEILMIPLRGHTLGHAGVCVETQSGWLLHAGDAYLHRGQMDLAHCTCPAGLFAYQHVMDSDRGARRANQQRLRALKAAQGARVKVFCSHDRAELEELQNGQ